MPAAAIGYVNHHDIQPYCKTLTAFQYDRDYTVSSWGWPSFMNALTHAGQPLIRHFKLLLDPTYNRLTCPPNLPANIDPVRVAADYFRELHTHIMTVMQAKFGDTVSNEDVLYVFTCPVWSDVAKNNLRKAAARAGFIPTADIMSTRLVIATEPEAAALWCTNNAAADVQMRNNETLLVIDAGGGTVDLTVERITSGPYGQTLAEVAQASGNNCGATLVDDHFLAWLGEKVGKEAMEELQQTRGTGYSSVLSTWETLKRQFRGSTTDTYSFSLPAQLYNLIDDDHQNALEEAQDGMSDEVHITAQDMLSFFDPVVNEILALVGRQLDRCPGKTVDKAFVVGGFSASQYLVGRIRERFE
ncbi:hypothetical protein HK097_004175, partial [Rhizophlyctis rosea]